MRRVVFGAVFLAGSGLLGGCGEEALDGFLWDVELLAVIDDCNDPTVAYADSLEYRVSFDGGAVELAVGPDAFATGYIAGCEINYETVVWGEDHNGYEVRWQMSGEAVYRQGDDTCNLPAGTDWIGTETFTIITSDDPALAVGCQYQLDVNGVYAGTAG
jgi:hypothetical protein